MRKIYSLVLMTAMLLVGTNAWADAVAKIGNTPFATIEEAFQAAVSGQTIELIANAPQTKAIVINDNRQLTLNLGNFAIDFSTFADSTAMQKPWNFEISHGKLVITGDGNGRINNNIKANNGTFEYKYYDKKTKKNVKKEIIVARLYGSETQTDSAYSVLEVRQGVKMLCTDSGKVAINVDQVGSTGKAFGVIVLFNGYCYGEKYGIQLSGNVNRVPYKDGTNAKEVLPGKAYFPYFHIQKNAEVVANANSPKAVGAYAAGYGEWKIEGYVHGSTGIYVKGGDITVNDATIASDNNTSTGINSSTKSGVNAGGNAIATESNGGYAGNITVTISGESTVTAGANGYAIQDSITTAHESNVGAITIQGGDFTGGASGCITIDNSAGESGETPQTINIELEGGTFTGDIETLIQNIDDDKIIETVVATDGEGNATVVIGKVDDTDKVIVPVKNEMPTVAILDTATVNSVIKLDADTAGGNIDLTLTNTDAHAKYLSINGSSTNAAKVTIPANHKLTVDQIVMNAYGQIVVEAGGKLLVSGSNGIFADNVNNLILKTDPTNGTAIFVLNSSVTTNRQPKAIVEMATEVYTTNPSAPVWQRFASPVINASAPIITPTATTFVKYLDPESQTWESLTSWSQLRPFAACAITNTTASGVKYTFDGRLIGNVTDSLRLQPGKWNYFGNSFIAPISTKALLNAFDSSVDKTIYFWRLGAQGYNAVNLGSFNDWGLEDESNINIPSMGFFAIRNISEVAGAMEIDYDNTVYGYAENPTAAAYNLSAPTRMSNISNKVRINIESESGILDKVYVSENAIYSADYDNGYDAEKMMNAYMNIYVAEEDMNYAMLATDNILGALITVQTTEDINYTLTFDKVGGEVYALRDNVTNAVVLMNEGATYNFTAQPNATLEGRFQIVSRQEMPTAVETIEETIAPKAIYTIMGQYVGETTNWNNLPAGVYVVDGVKIIK